MPTQTPGSHRSIGPYQILRELGRGGMGVVYLAMDPRLSREVAVKALPEHLALDPYRLERFQREASVLASLSHPHICQIFDIQEDQGSRYLILEYVPGESLDAKLSHGPLELSEALHISEQIARGVEAAHNRGIIHRDLKPDNVRVTPAGDAKVLDFGIAASATLEYPRPTSSEAETIVGAMPAEEAKVIGTPGYMSPEQARGKPIDKRTDVFSFGCVLYEMLTGKAAFPGETISDRIAAVLRAEPDWDRLPKDTPDIVRELLARCMVKDVGSRLRDLGDACLELQAARGKRGSGTRAHAPKVQGNLPAETTTFIGRDSQVARLRELIPTARLVTLAGPGGCGKTRLAVRLGRELEAQHDEGVWIVELAGVNEASAVAATVGAAIGLQKVSGVAPSLDALQARLAQSKMLLILDNCEHILQSVARLADALLRSCPALRIVATSREPLGLPGELVYRVPTLTLPGESDQQLEEMLQSESVRLFVERAKLAKAGFELTPANAAAISSICWRLDGIPLAIEFAAARVKVLSPDQINERLDQRFRLLTGGAAGVERQQTLRATVEWSYNLLTDEEKKLLCAWSVFAGGWTLEAAAAVAGGLDEFEVLDQLTRLVDKSLVSSHEDASGDMRYSMLETVRQFALERLEATGTAAEVRDRHAAAYVELARCARENMSGASESAWRQRMEAERENFLAAVKHMEARGCDPMAVLALTGALRRG
ncbi:MAG: protein kinase [Planctomycetes bacterium]|nr:protein kinase [Planctomycetota bacterium]